MAAVAKKIPAASSPHQELAGAGQHWRQHCIKNRANSCANCRLCSGAKFRICRGQRNSASTALHCAVRQPRQKLRNLGSCSYWVDASNGRSCSNIANQPASSCCRAVPGHSLVAGMLVLHSLVCTTGKTKAFQSLIG